MNSLSGLADFCRGLQQLLEFRRAEPRLKFRRRLHRRCWYGFFQLPDIVAQKCPISEITSYRDSIAANGGWLPSAPAQHKLANVRGCEVGRIDTAIFHKADQKSADEIAMFAARV